MTSFLLERLDGHQSSVTRFSCRVDPLYFTIAALAASISDESECYGLLPDSLYKCYCYLVVLLFSEILKLVHVRWTVDRPKGQTVALARTDSTL